MIAQTTVAGFPAFQIDTGPLALTLIPALGGKISSLRDTRSGREWLWRNPNLAYAQHGPTASYIALGDTGGWDECFPSVAACPYPAAPWADTPIPDHGELWCQPATVTIDADETQVTLLTIWHGLALPYRFERTLRLQRGAASVHVRYRVTNLGAAALHWIWSAHPLLAIEPGMRLLLPATARFNHWASVPADLLPHTTGITFPQVRPDLSLDPLPAPSAAIALKLWSDPVTSGWATVAASDGALRMTWDAALLPNIAFWFNCGAWGIPAAAPYYNLGLEPCIGAQDSLALAAAAGQCAVLAAGQERTWWLNVDLAGATP
jgi:galactose mutarotase-like enzyme